MPQPASPDLCIATVRTLAIDAVEKANSGHPGAPMGLAPVAWRLFTGPLRFAPANPEWPGRDRFVLSAGHASALLYALLNLTGYDLPISELKRFREWDSHTPGHPERGHTPGVEVTTGPLGQGIANAVGMALAERMLAADFNRPGHDIVNHRTWAICGDGDMMEGLSHEAASLAGFLGLERLVLIYDDNHVSLDGPTSLSFGEDVPARFRAYGWRVLHIEDGNDVDEIDRVLARAHVSDGRPTLIRCRTHIGFGAPDVQDTHKAHGSPLGPKETRLAKLSYGWPEDSYFLVPDEVREWSEVLRTRGRGLVDEWDAAMQAYAADHPAEAAELRRRLAGDPAPDALADLPRFEPGESLATRQASGTVLNAIAAHMPELVGGAADLASSTNTTITGAGDITPGHYDGRNIHFGVREHAMGGVLNGMAAHGGFRVFGSTFLTFSDYMKNTIRVASLMRVPVIYVFTHDSVALGQDGPTHQPIEQLAALRSIPGLVTIRPAEANETAAAWRVAIERTDGPTALVLTRQGLPVLDTPAPVERGGYVIAPGDDCALIATGSEVSLALAARDLLAADGISARVVSLPSFELFGVQPREYRDDVLPPAMRARVGVEAASGFGWERWTGSFGEVVAINCFGASAPGPEVMQHLGMTPEAVADAARRSINEAASCC